MSSTIRAPDEAAEGKSERQPPPMRLWDARGSNQYRLAKGVRSENVTIVTLL
jgi:hypothetical protein